MIRDTNLTNFNEKALALFQYQADTNVVYSRYLRLLGCSANDITDPGDIPFLPVSFFKQYDVVSGDFVAQEIFLSSSTTGQGQSRHLVADLELYRASFTLSFEAFYGPVSDYCVLALLPGYLERKGSSLIFMVQDFIENSGDRDSGFFLYDHEALHRLLLKKAADGGKVLLIGVSHALLDFAAAYTLPHNPGLIVMETGGMKGRRKEMLRSELHATLEKSFHTGVIHSEYGMTELMSQAYSDGRGIYRCPPWMKVLVKRQDDPLARPEEGIRGRLNIIDMANTHSCAFIETEDLGLVYPDGSFEVLGRMDFSEVRGCNVMV